MAFKSILIFLPFISMLGESDQRHRSGIRLNISEYTLSDLGDLRYQPPLQLPFFRI